MTTDLPIKDLLASAGFPGATAARARALLEEAGLTRAGKTRIARAKEARARAVLRDHLARLCGHPACAAQANGREVVVVPKGACESCAGSNNRRAGREASTALRTAGVRHLLVVGGTRTTHEALRDALEPGGLELRCVVGTEGVRPAATVDADLRWADVLVVWASTPLPHKVSQPYTDHASSGPPLITVPRRGVEAVCQALLEFVH